jgi:hypothetical protein
MSYPWIKDSQYGTTPLETGYLEVTSPKGLYLNSTTSGTNSNAILMKGFITGTSTPIISYYYCDKLRYFPNVWGGETFLSQDMLRFADSANTTLSQLNLSGLSCSNPGVNTYFQSSNNGQYQSIGSLGEEIFISSNSGSGNVYFSAANLYLNGTPIGGGGGVTDIQAGSGISVNQTTGSVTITNTGVLDIQAGSGISVNQTTGSVTITNTGGGGSYGIDYLQAGSGISVTQVSIGPNVWQIDNTGGGGGGVTDIQAGSGISVNQNTGSVTITNASTKYIFPTFDAGSIGNGGTAIGQGSQIFIPGGNYQITYTITFDNNFTQQPYEFRMVRAYCFLYSNTYGQTNPYMVSNVGFYPSQVITYDSRSYQNCITATDYITINNDDSYYLGVYQDNGSSIGSNNIFLSAILIKDNNNNNNNNN